MDYICFGFGSVSATEKNAHIAVLQGYAATRSPVRPTGTDANDYFCVGVGDSADETFLNGYATAWGLPTETTDTCANCC